MVDEPPQIFVQGVELSSHLLRYSHMGCMIREDKQLMTPKRNKRRESSSCSLMLTSFSPVSACMFIAK